MKKQIATIFIIFILLNILVGCTGNSDTGNKNIIDSDFGIDVLDYKVETYGRTPGSLVDTKIGEGITHDQDLFSSYLKITGKVRNNLGERSRIMVSASFMDDKNNVVDTKTTYLAYLQDNSTGVFELKLYLNGEDSMNISKVMVNASKLM